MQDTIGKIRKFRDERDWKQFHDPKNLAVSISIEAARMVARPGQSRARAPDVMS